MSSHSQTFAATSELSMLKTMGQLLWCLSCLLMALDLLLVVVYWFHLVDLEYYFFQSSAYVFLLGHGFLVGFSAFMIGFAVRLNRSDSLSLVGFFCLLLMLCLFSIFALMWLGVMARYLKTDDGNQAFIPSNRPMIEERLKHGLSSGLHDQSPQDKSREKKSSIGPEWSDLIQALDHAQSLERKMMVLKLAEQYSKQYAVQLYRHGLKNDVEEIRILSFSSLEKIEVQHEKRLIEAHQNLVGSNECNKKWAYQKLAFLYYEPIAWGLVEGEISLHYKTLATNNIKKALAFDWTSAERRLLESLQLSLSPSSRTACASFNQA